MLTLGPGRALWASASANINCFGSGALKLLGNNLPAYDVEFGPVVVNNTPSILYTVAAGYELFLKLITLKNTSLTVPVTNIYFYLGGNTDAQKFAGAFMVPEDGSLFWQDTDIDAYTAMTGRVT